MPDDKTLIGKPDRDRVSALEDYEVRHLAGKFGLPMPVVSQTILREGPMRKKVEAALRKLQPTA